MAHSEPHLMRIRVHSVQLFHAGWNSLSMPAMKTASRGSVT